MAVASSFDANAIFHQNIQRAAEHMRRRLERLHDHAANDAVQHALALLNYGLQSPDAWPAVSRILLLVTPHMERAGRWSDWLPYLYEGLAQSQEHHEIDTEAAIRFYLGVFAHQLGRYDEAIEHFSRSETLYARLGDERSRARTLTRQAAALKRKREFAKARELLWKAIHILGESDPETAHSFLLLGAIHHDQHQWEKAESYLRKAVELAQQREDLLRLAAWGCANLATTLTRQQAFEEAERCFHRAMTLFEKIDDPINRAIAQMNLGNMLLKQDQPAAAIEQYRSAFSIFRQVYDAHNLALIQINLGLAYRELGDWKQAEEAYLAGIESFQRLQDAERLANAIAGLGLVYLRQNRLDEAIEQLERALRLVPATGQTPRQAFLFNEITKHLQAIRGQENKAPP
ncbi:MAG: tetratricopeptide repeat protein [Chloroflexi bacterium]|nr:tetratricopeptide repeat protein [Chloroflexota bacterium]